MKRLLLVAIASTFAIAAAAQDRAATKAGDLPPVQAPPGMGDPGSPAVPLPSADAEVKSAISNATGETAKAIQGEPLPPEVQAAAEASELPVITVRQQGSDTVEEYRKKGKLYFVRVLSSSGPPKFYVDNPQAVPGNIMQQMSGPSGVVQPVYFKLLDWK
jgi:Protein of unknown function (DUF2782)